MSLCPAFKNPTQVKVQKYYQQNTVNLKYQSKKKKNSFVLKWPL